MFTMGNFWQGVDLTQPDPAALNLTQLNNFLAGMIDQPSWRPRADVEADYYDSNQFDSKTLKLMEERGIPPIVVNLIAPTINMVLGLEAKTRSDTIVKPVSERDSDLAAALTIKMKEAERCSGGDRASADAYAAQIKVGLGWVETNWNYMNPFEYPLRESYVHRREIWWDWMDDDPLLKRARWLMRRKWYDEDVAQAFFPDYKDLIYQAVRSWSHFDPAVYGESGVPMFMDRSVERDWGWNDEEWRDTYRRRVCLYELWYRTISRGYVLRTKSGQVIEYQQNNPLHNAAIAQGAARVQQAMLPKMRLSWWMGPYKLVDVPTPLPHQDFPYTPFWGYREDRTLVPYGMIRAMRPLQDEVNARRARMMWQLAARRVIGDDDAVLDWNQTRREIARPDAVIKMNSKRINKRDRLTIEDNSQLNAQQYEAYVDSKKTLQDSAGVFLEQLGKAGAADSGIAISQLIDQGTTTLAEINDNYRFARMGVAEKRLAHVRVMLKNGTSDAVTIEKFGRKKKVYLNRPAVDPETQVPYLENDTTMLQARIAMEDVPQTPTARQEQFRQLTDLVKGLPPNMQSALVTIVVKASDVPQKEEMLHALKQALGIQDADPEDMTPEEQAQYAQAMKDNEKMKQLQQELAQAQKDLVANQAKLAEANANLSKAKTAGELVKNNINPELANVGLDTDELELPIEDTPGHRMIERAHQAASDSGIPGADAMKVHKHLKAMDDAERNGLSGAEQFHTPIPQPGGADPDADGDGVADADADGDGSGAGGEPMAEAQQGGPQDMAGADGDDAAAREPLEE